jgi:integrase
MIRRRVGAAGIGAPGITCHTFRATSITLYMANGGTLEVAQEMAAHASSKTTTLYDHSGDRRTQAEVKRVVY